MGVTKHALVISVEQLDQMSTEKKREMSKIKTIFNSTRELHLECGCVIKVTDPIWQGEPLKIGWEWICPNGHKDPFPPADIKEFETALEDFGKVKFSDGKGYTRNGSPIFYKLLNDMAEIHDKKSADYASNSNPFGNYKFAGMLSKLFDDPDDSGFISRIGEKLYRLANLENSVEGTQKVPNFESIEDTETDVATIVTLWIAMRRERRDSVGRLLAGVISKTLGGTGG